MPWTKVTPMDARIEFVVEACLGVESISQLCRKYGISRKTGYKWINRAEEQGLHGLRELSRAPKVCPHKTPVEMREALITLRKTYPGWGPKKLAWELRNTHGLIPPAPSTIAEILKGEGLTRPRRKRSAFLRKWPDKLTIPDHPNHVWTVDYKGWIMLLNEQKCWPLTVMDLHSRYMIGCEPLDSPALIPTLSVFKRLFTRFGLPAIIRVDNGTPFAGCGAGGLSRLSALWLRLGIDVEFTQPGKPQQNGAHERMHRSFKREVRNADSIARQARRCRAWRRKYNHSRAHEALKMRVPAELYKTSKRRYPSVIPDFSYPDCYMLRCVKHNGEISWQGKKKYINHGLHGCTVGLKANRHGSMNVYAGTVFLGVVDSSGSRGLIRPLEPEGNG